MSLFKKSFYQSASLIPLSFLKKLGSGDILLPYHHLVSDESRKHVQHLYPYKNKKQFVKDLDYLLTHFRAVHPEELILASQTGQKLSPDGFLLSFDDGLSEAYDTIAPILQQKGISAFFFLNPAFLDNRELFYRCKLSLVLDALEFQKPGEAVLERMSGLLGIPGTEKNVIQSAVLGVNYLNRKLADDLGDCLELSFDEYLKKVKPYLLTDQVKELIRKGFYFGAHSLDHPNYRLISLEEQLFQTRESCKYMRRSFGISYTAFSFPHEDAGVKQVFFDELQREPSPSIDVFFGTQNQKIEIQNRMFHRFNAERPEYPIEGLVKGLLLYNLKRRTIKRTFDQTL
jgi:peptidoglycan/xylan/chitin deacetylase (PgdA/CDA1 family)